MVLIFAAFTGSSEISIGSLVSAKGVKLPFYRGTELSATLTIDRIFQEYPKKGFLRIGIAPRPVMEDVTVTILNGTDLTNAFGKVCHKLSQLATSKYSQLLRVTFIHGNTRLQMSHLEISEGEQWKAYGNVVLETNGGTVTANGGLLSINGPNAGQFTTSISRRAISINLLEQQGTNQTHHEKSPPPSVNHSGSSQQRIRSNR